MNGGPDRMGQAEEGLLAALRAGSVSVPMLLLTSYAKLDLTELEAMLLLHLIGFRDREQNEFPTPDDLQSRMSVSAEQVAGTLGKLIKEGFLQIDEADDPISGMRYEKYSWEGLWQKLAAVWAMERKLSGGAVTGVAAGEPGGLTSRGGAAAKTSSLDSSAREASLYYLFEKEFARPLTPMELETISGWLDQDRYPEELILMALKEAVFAGKIHFRYIDRILLEWKRSKVYTAEQARDHAARFRGGSR